MKLNWQAIVNAVAAIYKAFFSGKKVGGVVLPDEKPGMPPLRGSQFDSTPHQIEPPRSNGRPF